MSVCAAAAVPTAAHVVPARAAAPTPSPAASPQVTEVTICIPAQTDSTLPAFAAEDGGYLREEGLHATLPYFAGARVDAAFIAGQCALALNAGGEGPLLNGFDAVVVAATTIRSPFEIWARPDLRSMADLKGRRLGTSGPGSLSWRTGRYYLRQQHLAPNMDVILVPISSAVTTVGALLGGRIDAAVLSPPLTAEVQKEGMRLLYTPPENFRLIVQAITTTRRYRSAHPGCAHARLWGPRNSSCSKMPSTAATTSRRSAG